MRQRMRWTDRAFVGPCLSLWLLLGMPAAATCTPAAPFPAGRQLAWLEEFETPAAERQYLEQLATDNPLGLLALARIRQRLERALPDDILQRAVAAALRREAPWEHTEAALRAFDLYQERPWAQAVLAPFVAYQGANIILNAQVFAALHRGWTQNTIERLGMKMPRAVLGELPHLVAIEPAWAKGLAEALLTLHPGLAFVYAEVLVAVDPVWAQRPLQAAARVSPAGAVRALSKVLATSWGPQLFAEAALKDTRSTMTLAATEQRESAGVRQALLQSREPRLQVLAQIAQGDYPYDLKVRMASFVEDIATARLSLDAAAQLSSNEREYFAALVQRRLADPGGDQSAVDFALQEEALTLIELINRLHDQPAAVRFRAVEAWNALELYMPLAYGEADIFTSSYRGLFERLLAKMQRAGLSGDQLLAQVQYVRFNTFIKSAAIFNRLATFLATIPSPVARWSLLTRSLSDMERAPDMLEQAVTAAEILGTPLDASSRRLIRDLVKNEYARLSREQNRQALAVYGLLAARLYAQDREASEDQTLRLIAQPYLQYLPDLSRLSLSRLFPNGRNIQRHYFYHDDDGEASFQSFLASYRRSPAWHLLDKGTYVLLSAEMAGRQMEIYANKPAADEQASRDIAQELQAQGVEPQVVVHRGHSYYVEETIERIPPTAALVFLGSCGSALQLDVALARAPQAHLITTRGIASSATNDPLLKAFTDYALQSAAIVWPAFWKQAEALLGHDPRFLDYVAPDKNATVTFLTAYRRLVPSAVTGRGLRR
ncbi:MAG: hypothetical protein AB7N91_03890 [Candidatus Tectimicrobiota bacterium]